MHDAHVVFVSYSKDDKEAAIAACQALEQAGIRCWIAPRDVTAGDDFSEAIPRAIEGSEVFLLIFSSRANASKQVTRELHLAVSNIGTSIVPIRTEAFEPVGAMRYLLAGLHWLDASSDRLDAALVDLVAHIRRIVAGDQTASTASRVGNLPAETTTFYGRDLEVAELDASLATARMVTLTGAGGVGKTRLSLKVATRISPRFQRGAWLVELASVSEPGLVAPTLARTLSVHEQAGRTLIEALAAAIGDRELLLVLDNCEHLLDEVARIANELLNACPGLRILATSREPMRISAEHVYRVGSLPLPDDSDTVDAASLTEFAVTRLFTDRAKAVNPKFQLTDDNASAFRSLCRRLDGVPLALELAAARTPMMTLDQLNERLDQRFDLLARGSRAALPRHQTLRALIDWSYSLLSTQEALLFRRLAIFSGRFLLAAMTNVCSDEALTEWEVIELASQLVDKSLVVADAQGPDMHYRLLESMREFATQELASRNEVEPLMLSLAKYTRDVIIASGQDAAGQAAVDFELDNMRTVLRWAIEQDSDLLLGANILIDMSAYWQASGKWSEATFWYDKVLASADLLPNDQRIDLLLCAGNIAHLRQDHDRAVTILQDLLTSPDVDATRRARALNALAGSLLYSGRAADAERSWLQSLELVESLGNEAAAARILANLATVSWDEHGDANGALERYERALSIHRKHRASSMVALTLGNMAEVYRASGDLDTAADLTFESLELYRLLRNDSFVADRTLLLARIALDRHDDISAASSVTDALNIFVRLEQEQEIADCATLIAQLLVRNGDAEGAATLAGFGTERRHGRRFVTQVQRRNEADLSSALDVAVPSDRLRILSSAGSMLEPAMALDLAKTALRAAGLLPSANLRVSDAAESHIAAGSDAPIEK
jgi:non-specific serine/threonine protein kinase